MEERGRWAHLAALAVAVLGVGCGSALSRTEPGARAGDQHLHDLSYGQTTSFVVSDVRDGYRIRSKTRISITYHSVRSTQVTTFAVSERHYAPIDSISAEINGSRIPASQISKTAPDQDDVFISDLRVHNIDFKRVEPGSTIVYRYQRRYLEPAFLHPLFVPNIDRTRRFVVAFEHPEEVRVDFEVFFPRERFPYKVARSSSRTIIAFSELRHVDPLPHFRFNDYSAAILPRLSTSTGQQITPSTAAAFGRWYQRKLASTPALPPGRRGWLKELVKDATSRREKMEAIYNHVRRKVRYMADFRRLQSIVPRAPEAVLERGMGDCKEKAYLITTLAGMLGIDAHLVLVGTARAAPFEGLSLTAFDHAIATFLDDGRRVYMDATCRSCELGALPEEDVGKPGLLLDGAGSRKIRIPAPQQRPSLDVMIDTAVDGLDRGRARIVLRNQLSFFARELAQKPDSSLLQDGLSSILGQRLYKIALSRFRLEKNAEDHLVLSAKTDLTAFVVRSSTRLYLPKTPFRAFGSELLRRGKDPYPIHLENRPYHVLRLELSAPGYALGAPAVERWGSRPTAWFEAQLERQGDRHIATYTYQQGQKELRGAERSRFLAFCGRYLRAKRELFALERRRR